MVRGSGVVRASFVVGREERKDVKMRCSCEVKPGYGRSRLVESANSICG